MDLKATEEALRDLDVAALGADLIYPLLRAYDHPKTSITKLRNGDLNSSSQPDEVLWKGRVWFRHITDGTDIHIAIDDAQRNDAIIVKKPRFLLVTDADRLVAVDTKRHQTLDVPFHELPANVAFFWAWTGVERTPLVVANQQADVKAAQRMAKLYDEIRRLNRLDDDDEIAALNAFFCRLLFCFFAEDTGIFPKGRFTDLVNELTQSDGTDTQAVLGDLFEVLATPLEDRTGVSTHFAQFGYVNGDLFAGGDSEVPRFSARARGIILESSQLDWAKINPDIFGSMMQAVVRTDDREALGMHYTSEENILKVLNPLFLDELSEAFDAASDSVAKLDKLRKRIAKIRVFDPACGSGNFLVVAYKRLRELEDRILQRRFDLEGYEAGALFTEQSVISLDNFHGIEIDEFAVAVARLSLWLAKHQMNLEFAELFEVDVSLIPLTDAGHIVCANATRIDWQSVCPANATDEVYVCGNPPYLGSSMQDAAHKADLRAAFGTAHVDARLDYVCAWFIVGAAYVSNGKARLGFVATSSVTQGIHVGSLWSSVFEQGVRISFAWKPFTWTNSAHGLAGVTVAVIGLDAGTSPCRLLSPTTVQVVSRIQGDLSAVDNWVAVSETRRQLSGLPHMSNGSKPSDGGHLVLTRDEADELVRREPDASRYLKDYLGAAELMNGIRRRCIWIEEGDASSVSTVVEVKERISRVREFRLASRKATTRSAASRSWQFEQCRYKEEDAVVVPGLTSQKREYIPIGLVGPQTVVSNLAHAIYGGGPWVFGLVQSRMHMVWARAVAGRLKTDIRYSATLVYNTFPVPTLTHTQRSEIEEVARRLLQTREHFFDRTLAQLYDPEKMPSGLYQAHRALDDAVDRLYLPPGFGSDEERRRHLLDRYVAIIGTQA